MIMIVKAALLILALGLFLGNLAGLCNGALQVGFYSGKCGFADVEAIVAGVVTPQFFKDPTIVAALLRLQFHDCFVNGCDASLLLDGRSSEKTAPPNLSVRGYDIIDQAKTAVERACPGVVSCADLIAIATRDVVFLSGGGRYNVQTGRRDGLISAGQNVSILGPKASVPEAVAAFAEIGLNTTDMVLLLGAHSVGVTHCSLIKDRLYDFEGSGNPDPLMDPFLVNLLRFRCPQFPAIDNTVNLDQNPFSPFFMDVSYYQNIMMHRGILQIDQELGMDPLTMPIVRNLAGEFDFPTRFGAAMVKLGTIGVLTDKQGEIRRSCRATNNET
ncbi:peroxidase 60 [Ricinus communis]|uniref:Peroxidase n=1 Tax=Ricinus communis TaxID=3988 RepID=B9RA28_RICCO|nr:peroxidase 60 [Ricinus communis]EEF51655.1 Peroxidase 60 precursor, putative [Ricinus communis]|eukprot:XP_002511053.1 peroxidase 60 [Ricinus communis]